MNGFALASVTGCHNPPGGRDTLSVFFPKMSRTVTTPCDSKTAFLQSKIVAVTGVTTSRLKNIGTKYVGKQHIYYSRSNGRDTRDTRDGGRL